MQILHAVPSAVQEPYGAEQNPLVISFFDLSVHSVRPSPRCIGMRHRCASQVQFQRRRAFFAFFTVREGKRVDEATSQDQQSSTNSYSNLKEERVQSMAAIINIPLALPSTCRSNCVYSFHLHTCGGLATPKLFAFFF